VVLQVLPFGAGSHQAWMATKESDIERATVKFERLRTDVPSPSDSVALIEDVLDRT
jgi:hypothetical protein